MFMWEKESVILRALKRVMCSILFALSHEDNGEKTWQNHRKMYEVAWQTLACAEVGWMLSISFLMTANGSDYFLLVINLGIFSPSFDIKSRAWDAFWHRLMLVTGPWTSHSAFPIISFCILLPWHQWFSNCIVHDENWGILPRMSILRWRSKALWFIVFWGGPHNHFFKKNLAPSDSDACSAKDHTFRNTD